MQQIQQLLHFQGHTIYRKPKGVVVDDKGRVLSKHENALRTKMWISDDLSIAYEQNVEPHYLFQRISFRGEDGLYHIYGVSMNGFGNIPCESTLASHEILRKPPYILKKDRGTYGHRDEEDIPYPMKKSTLYIYPSKKDIDKMGRPTVMTVISRDFDETQKVRCNAFDLKIKYMPKTCKPEKLMMRPANLKLICDLVPEAYNHGTEITDLTRAVFGKFGIDIDTAIRPKSMLVRPNICHLR